MTKRVPPNSLEHALRRALLILGEDGAEEAIFRGTGVYRSASLLRKFADADDHRHQIQLRYASALDIACVMKGHLPPLLEAQKQKVAAHFSERPQAAADAYALSRSLMELQATLGGIAAGLRSSIDPAVPAGGGLRDEEKLVLVDALETLIDQARALGRLIGSPTGEQPRPVPEATQHWQ